MESKAIINTMEVLETKPLNELVSEVIIKVCYVSDEPNANRTIINRDVGKQIAETLPGAPVAGFFNKDVGDFEEHSRQIIFTDSGDIILEDITKPYGFVSPIDSPWYQDFEEDGEIRTYLMCKAYLWTRQYEEASLAINKGQSMEIHEEELAGYVQGDVFVFTNATIDKLCILGDKYSPCFSGAKIMTTYTKQFGSLAEQLGDILGRRYYVMKDKLVQKPTYYSIEAYALQLGWNLEGAVYQQLANRGADTKYSIVGVYTENGEVFVILQDRESLENVKCSLKITSQDTVELGTDMVAVTQKWETKSGAAATTEPIREDAAMVVADQNALATATAEYTKEEAPNEEVSKKYTEETAKEEVSKEYTKEETPAAPATPTTAVEVAIPAEFMAKYEDMMSKISEFENKISDYKSQIETANSEIINLKETIATYKAAEVEALTEKKNEMISSYKGMLTEEEIANISKDIGNFSLDELEAKLAVTYARKQKATNYSASGVQVDIANIGGSEVDIPDFIKQAQEYDNTHNLRIV